MKSTCFSTTLVFLGAGLASAGNTPRQEAFQGLRRLPGAQGVVVSREDVTAAPELKPIPGSAVQVTSLQPLLPVATSAVVDISDLLATSTSALTTESGTSTANVLGTGLTTTSVSQASNTMQFKLLTRAGR